MHSVTSNNNNTAPPTAPPIVATGVDDELDELVIVGDVTVIITTKFIHV